MNNFTFTKGKCYEFAVLQIEGEIKYVGVCTQEAVVGSLKKEGEVTFSGCETKGDKNKQQDIAIELSRIINPKEIICPNF